jgi:cell division protein DivIC
VAPIPEKLKSRRMKLLKHVPSWLKSKYLIAIGTFAVIMFFLDKNDLLTGMERKKELRELEQSKEFYTRRIATERAELEALKTNPATLEKYARENYLMKKDNEDLFIISEKHELGN